MVKNLNVPCIHCKDGIERRRDRALQHHRDNHKNFPSNWSDVNSAKWYREYDLILHYEEYDHKILTQATLDEITSIEERIKGAKFCLPCL